MQMKGFPSQVGHFLDLSGFLGPLFMIVAKILFLFKDAFFLLYHLHFLLAGPALKISGADFVALQAGIADLAMTVLVRFPDQFYIIRVLISERKIQTFDLPLKATSSFWSLFINC